MKKPAYMSTPKMPSTNLLVKNELHQEEEDTILGRDLNDVRATTTADDIINMLILWR